MRANSGNSDEE